MMKHIKREQFIWDFLKKNQIPSLFKNVSLNNTLFINRKFLTEFAEKSPLIVNVSLFPTFLEYKLINETFYNTKKINNTNLLGAGISIEPDQTLERYINKTLSAHSRKNINRYKNRLETSFNINYEFYYGQITDDKYDFLISTLFHMLTKRFDEKDIDSTFLLNWDAYTKNLYDLINKKAASLFVIYHNEKPINISLNYHVNHKILFCECGAFDTDYSKFGLGHIDNYVLLKWCIENKYIYLDLGNGVSDYKKKWCNNFYDFQYLIFYKKNSIFAQVLLKTELVKITIKNNLKKIGVDQFYKNLRRFSNKRNTETINLISYDLKALNDFELKKYLQTNEVALDLSLYPFLNKPIYDFLYTNVENIDNVSAYKLSNKLNSYIIKGKNNQIEISFRD